MLTITFRLRIGVMKNFVETIEDPAVHLQTAQALAGAKPFRNFKYVMDKSGPIETCGLRSRKKH